MGICKGEIFAKRDVYVDYPYEKVMCRWDYKKETIHVKFYGDNELPDTMMHDNKLFNNAITFGEEITEDEYIKGKPAVT